MSFPYRKRQDGFTLIELVIVMVLISIMLTLAVPSMRESLLTDNLRNGARELIGTVKTLRNQAVREQEAYLLNIDTAQRRIWSVKESEEGKEADDEEIDGEEDLNEFILSPAVIIQDVWTRSEGVNDSELISLRIAKHGYMDETLIHFIDETGESLSLFFYSFMDSVKVLDGYVPPESFTSSKQE